MLFIYWRPWLALHGQHKHKPCPANALMVLGMGLISNTDFVPFIGSFLWGESMSEGTDIGPRVNDLDGDGRFYVHDVIIATSQQQQQNCKAGES
tara:strand:- start:1015 stop:1296 length:282 start_codon:yes stop_codon:yes gene_type:complete